MKKDENNKRNVIAKCKCGKVKSVNYYSIKYGKSKSCGCVPTEEKIRYKTKEEKRIRNIHSGMMDRCYNENSNRYYEYGARGIHICKEWYGKDGIRNFINWSLQNGYSNNLTIDRIDNNKGYSPDNCRWVDTFTQANNTRRNIKITIDGIEKTLTQYAHEYGIKPDLAWKRFKKGITGRDLFLPPSKIKIHKEVEVIDENNETHIFKTQNEVAKFLGVSQSIVNKYIKGISNPKRNIIVKLKED